jgi:hypothetical protein
MIKDKIKRQEYFKEYRQLNKEQIKKQKQQYYNNNKEEIDNKTNKNREKHPWIRFYVNAKQRCTNSKNPSYKWYGAKGIKFKLTLSEIKDLWFRDKAYELKNPSIDRIDSTLDYTYDNCRFIDRWLNATKKVESN